MVESQKRKLRNWLKAKLGDSRWLDLTVGVPILLFIAALCFIAPICFLLHPIKTVNNYKRLSDADRA